MGLNETWLCFAAGFAVGFIIVGVPAGLYLAWRANKLLSGRE